jgi:hypothetical protein
MHSRQHAAAPKDAGRRSRREGSQRTKDLSAHTDAAASRSAVAVDGQPRPRVITVKTGLIRDVPRPNTEVCRGELSPDSDVVDQRRPDCVPAA